MKKYELNIRRAKAADSGIMADIHCRSWSAAYSGLLPEEAIRQKNATRSALWSRLLQTEQTGAASYFLAEMNGTPAGMISFGAYREKPTSSMGEIHAIYLLPEWFRRGIGTALLDFAMRELKKLEYQQVCLWALSTNRNAIAFYEKNGFVQDLCKQEFIGKTVTELRYSRTL